MPSNWNSSVESDQKLCETCWRQTESPDNQTESLPSCENIEDDQEEDLDYSYRFSTPSFLIQSHTVPESRKTLPLTLTTSESSTEGNQHERRPIITSPCDIVKYLISSGSGDSTTKEKFSWTGRYETLQDLVSLVLKRSGTWSERYQPNTVEGNEAKLMARVFKSQTLMVTWYVNTKTLQIQGSESEESCQYLSKLLKEHTKKQESTVTKSTNAMANLSTIPNRTEVTDEKPKVTGDSDCYSFCSKSEYEYSFTEKNDYHFSELLADNLSTDKHPHRSPEKISNNFGSEIKNIWSAINTLFNRNIETGKFFISLITEEREKSKYLETELMERSIEVEKLKAEIKLMKFVNNNLSTELRTDEDTNTVTIGTEHWQKPRRTVNPKTPPPSVLTQTCNRFDVLEECVELPVQQDILTKTKQPPFEIELENVKLQKKVDYLQHKLNSQPEKLTTENAHLRNTTTQPKQKQKFSTSKNKTKKGCFDLESKNSQQESKKGNPTQAVPEDKSNNTPQTKNMKTSSDKEVQDNEQQKKTFKLNKTYIIGDSILNNINEKRLSNKRRNVKVYSLSGATTRDLKDFIRPLAETKPGKVIIHCGTNDVRDYTAEEVTNNLIDLKSLINEISPDAAVIFSTLTLRTDSNNLMKKVTEVNICLQNSCKKHNIELVDNSNINKRGLSAKGLHLNMSGTTRLAMNFKALLNRF